MIDVKELKKRAKILTENLAKCSLCPRNCQVNRLKGEGEKGFCRVGKDLIVCSFGPHFGEESCLVGLSGSGTIFFSFCNLHCVFCQNYTISQLGEGKVITAETLAGMMLNLQKQGCHNINLVSPTHVIAQIVSALAIAVEKGLNLPIVYNSGGYDSVETLKILKGIIDIYMPDFKYGRNSSAQKYSEAPNYPEVAKLALKEMHGQVGDLAIDEGIAQRGLLVRHLLLPEKIAGTKELMHFLATETSPDTFVNLMDQYHPCYRAREFPELTRGITEEEYGEALKIAREEGLWRFV